MCHQNLIFKGAGSLTLPIMSNFSIKIVQEVDSEKKYFAAIQLPTLIPT